VQIFKSICKYRFTHFSANSVLLWEGLKSLSGPSHSSLLFRRSSEAVRDLLPAAPGQQGGKEPGHPQEVPISAAGGGVGGKRGHCVHSQEVKRKVRLP
jgi:hypothetical protein